MAQSYAEENEINVSDLFKKNPVSGNTIADTEPEPIVEEFTMDPIIKEDPPVKKQWTPDASLIEDMDEMKQTPITYSVDEIKASASTELKDITDDNALQASHEAMDDMSRKHANIEEAKRRFGIKHLRIPEGPFHVRIFTAAGDTNFRRSQEALRELFQEIVNTYPDFVLEWDTNKTPVQPQILPSNEQSTDINSDTTPDIPTDPLIPSISSGDTSEAKVIIDKTSLPEVSWTKEEMDKIRKSRSVELNIVEDLTLKYTNIEDVNDNAVDIILSQYVRKVNDVPGSLPASKYRATFTGLTYTEILDLSYSQEMNNLDGERKKWSIAYDHLKNPSIGTFTDYNDFLRKTSFMDLEFMLWKILCATAMDQEIISIDCHGTLNGTPCKRSYDWIYSPRELLVMDSINLTVLEEMKKTGETQSLTDIESNYKESMLLMNNSVELATSKFGVVFGHISAYDYLNYIYSEIQTLQSQDNPMLSQALSYSTLTIIKSFLIPKSDGGYARIQGAKNLIRVINTLDEIDWQTLSELVRIMLEPYQFKFTLRNIVCPQCKTKSNIEIEDMSRLLFILARSLSSVQVALKRT